MSVRGGDTWADVFITKDGTGALVAAGVGPVGTLYVNGIANAAVVAIAGANPYSWSVVLPALAAGDRVSMYITATVAAIATGSVVASEQADFPVTLAATQSAITWAAQTISVNAATPALTVTNAGTGNAVRLYSESGHTVLVKQNTDNSNCGVKIESDGTGIWLAAVNDNALEFTSDTQQGIMIIGGASGIYCEGDGGPGIAVRGWAAGQAGVQILGSAVNSPGLKIAANGTAAGIDVDGGATGVGVDVAAAGADAVRITSAAGDGLQVVGAGAGNHDIRADIHGIVDNDPLVP